MPDTLTTIVTSAAVAAIVSSAALAWNGSRDRLSRISLEQMQERHQTSLRDLARQHEANLRDLDRRQEADLRALDRDHESRLQELADRRALRDLKVERLRTNLRTVVDAALKLGDREVELRMAPKRFAEPALVFDEARRRLSELRADLVLDTESERLLKAIAIATQQYDALVIALDHWKTQAEQASAAAAAGPGVPVVTGSQEAFDAAQKRAEDLSKWVHEIIDSARKALETVEQAIV